MLQFSKVEILEDNNFDATRTEKEVEPFKWWLMATVPDGENPKNNRLVGFLRIPTRQLIKDLSIQHDEEAENMVETSVARNRGNIPGKIFSNVVGVVIEILKTNPSTYSDNLMKKKWKILLKLP